jgi:hypothetical protein
LKRTKAILEPARNRGDTERSYQCRYRTTRGVAMTAIARAFLRTIPAISSEFDTLKTIALFCGAGLLISLLHVWYGVNMDYGVF